MFLNLEIENVNEKADRCLRTASQSGCTQHRRRTLCLGPGRRGRSGHIPLHWPDTTEFLEGKQAGGRKKEKGNRRGKKRGRGHGLFI